MDLSNSESDQRQLNPMFAMSFGLSNTLLIYYEEMIHLCHIVNINADNTVGQPSRANADPISDPSGIG
ncbi:hypothetical protein BCR32DRAFT_275134 [Anaeromyces robustus]|uniref:Uncharacterized protein n=1 Tax=Anaeromyces robustus TaxID=1754192 RepID=A0A1Y1XLZ9_9FUNG|nr:hypothetical protein BCR32DRAFT_275134 [Anaeromyces robustus]|eukprot:ORX86778.1 hypothetical protein BCR32DRAFT_275134 [Anaeromyces robustus]